MSISASYGNYPMTLCQVIKAILDYLNEMTQGTTIYQKPIK